MPPEFGRKWGTELLNTRFPLPTLLCAGYSVKLKQKHVSICNENELGVGKMKVMYVGFKYVLTYLYYIKRIVMKYNKKIIFCLDYSKIFIKSLNVADNKPPERCRKKSKIRKRTIRVNKPRKGQNSLGRKPCQIRLCNKNKTAYTCNKCNKYVCGRCTSKIVCTCKRCSK